MRRLGLVAKAVCLHQIDQLVVGIEHLAAQILATNAIVDAGCVGHGDWAAEPQHRLRE